MEINVATYRLRIASPTVSSGNGCVAIFINDPPMSTRFHERGSNAKVARPKVYVSMNKFRGNLCDFRNYEPSDRRTAVSQMFPSCYGVNENRGPTISTIEVRFRFIDYDVLGNR